MAFGNRLINAGGLPPQPPGTGALISTSDVGLVISVDDGVNWTQDGIVHNFSGLPNRVVWAGNAFLCTDAVGRIHRSVDGYNWDFVYAMASASPVLTLASNGPICIAAVRHFPSANEEYLRIYKSGDNGLTWSQRFSVNNGISGGANGGSVSPSGWCHFGYSNGQAYSNGGDTWTWQGLNSGRQAAIGWSNNFTTGYSGYNGGLWYSTSTSPGSITSWSLNGGYASPLTSSADRIVGNGGSITLWRTTASGFVYRSTGSASSWSAVNHFTSYPSSQFVYHNGKFIVYYNSNIIGSTNGSTWSTISTPTGYAFYQMASMGKINY